MNKILELIIIGSKIFAEERQRYYDSKAKKLLKQITDVEDSSFYNKDMDKKGKAERQLLIDTEDLRKEFVKEATK